MTSEERRTMAKVCIGLSRICKQLAKEAKTNKQKSQLYKQAEIFKKLGQLYRRGKIEKDD